eukprot:gene2961-1943_t
MLFDLIGFGLRFGLIYLTVLCVYLDCCTFNGYDWLCVRVPCYFSASMICFEDVLYPVKPIWVFRLPGFPCNSVFIARILFVITVAVDVVFGNCMLIVL